ncbi:MAG: exonuclease SbcCD subunit D C-terminal domain-containing protein, partial [Selenomonadales bacterium]|nr:exonuclease SbcCD subunit D C-terminal domain-containing protein [Selenomonadales bacterium]
SFSEVDQKKGVQLVELASDGSVRTETVSFTPKRDMRIVEGTFDALMAGEGSEDYIAVKLLDQDPILDAKGRLEKKFPHLLQLERACFVPREERDMALVERPKMTEAERFAVFFEAMTGDKMTDEQKRCLAETIDEVNEAQREVKV